MAKTRKFLIKNFKVLVFFLGFLILSAGVVYAFTGPGSQSPGSGSGAITVDGDNVGIGTDSPDEKLHIEGNLQFSSSGTATDYRTLSFYGTGGLNGNLLIRDKTNPSDNWMGLNILDSGVRFITASDAFRFYTHGDAHLATIQKNGSVGIGNTSPSYKLDVSGTGRFTQPVIVATPTSDGHATTKSYVDSTASGGSLWTASGDNIYNTNSGNVGIGITNPSGGLVVNLDRGNLIRLERDQPGEESMMRFRSRNAADSAWLHADIATYAEGGYLGFKVPHDGIVGSGYRMVITDGGNVGIGTTGPSYELHVTGDIYANGGWLRASGSKGLYFQSYGGGWNMTDSTYIRSYGSKVVYVDNEIRSSTKMQAPIFYDHNDTSYYANPAGQSRMNQSYLNYLGVGTSVDTSYRIYATGVAYGIRAFGSTMGGRFEDSNSSARVYAGYGSYDIYANGTGLIQATGSMRAPIFYDSDNTSYYINPGSTGTSGTFAGNVGIGTTSPGADLHVGGSTCTGEGCGSNDIWASADITAGDDVIAVDKFKFAGTPTGGTTLCYQDASVAPFFEIIRCSSSERFKENIENLKFDAIGTIKKLRPVEYNWIEENGGKRDLGFIAEEVAQIDPILAIYEKDEEGNERVLSVKYDHITALLTKAIQEQQTIIKENQEKIRSLEERIEKIENGNRID